MNIKLNRKYYGNGIELSEPYKEDAKLFISPSASNRLKVLDVTFRSQRTVQNTFLSRNIITFIKIPEKAECELKSKFMRF
jgi:hypothetical protein